MKSLALYLKYAYCGINIGIPLVAYAYLSYREGFELKGMFIFLNFWFVFIFMAVLQKMIYVTLPNSASTLFVLLLMPYVWLVLINLIEPQSFIVNLETTGLAYTLGVAIAWFYIMWFELKGLAGHLIKALSPLLLISIYFNVNYYLDACLSGYDGWQKWLMATTWMTAGIHNAVHYVLLFRKRPLSSGQQAVR